MTKPITTEEHREPEGLNVSGISGERLKDFSFKLLWDGEPGRAYVTQTGLSSIAANDHIVARLKNARDKARRNYNAPLWVALNKIIGDKEPNPFKRLMDAAKREAARPGPSSRAASGADESQAATKLISGVLEQ